MGKAAYKKSRGYIPPRDRRRAYCEICNCMTTVDMLFDGLCLRCEEDQRAALNQARATVRAAARKAQ